MEEQNYNTSKSVSFEFEQISRFVSERLNDPNNDFIRYKNRDVYIKTDVGEKKVVIPSKENMTEWQQAWINVFEVCLYALQMKVNSIYRIGKKEGHIEEVNQNEVRVGDETVKIPDDHMTVNYARSLEKIINLYDTLKVNKKRNNPISVKLSHITIDNPDKVASSIKTNINTVSVPVAPVVNQSSLMSGGAMKPKASTVIRPKKVEMSHDERRVNTVRMTMANKRQKDTQEKPTNIGKQLEIQKIPMNMLLDRSDCEKYREQSLVVATCSSVKNDVTYRDNIDMLKVNVPSVSIGSFISGKAVNDEQAVKEATRMLRLLNDCGVSKLVIYEINNDYINEHLDKPEVVSTTVESAFKICDVLADGSYYPILCMDFETAENIRSVLPKSEERYPVIKCVTPKQIDLITPSDDILYMNPSSDNDMIRVSSSLVQTNLQEIPKKTVRESYSMAA